MFVAPHSSNALRSLNYNNIKIKYVSFLSITFNDDIIVELPLIHLPIGHFGCYDPSLGFVTKAKACKGVSQKGSMRVTFHTPRSVGKCEGMNPHTPKWVPTLRVGVLMESQIFREVFQGPNSLD